MNSRLNLFVVVSTIVGGMLLSAIVNLIRPIGFADVVFFTGLALLTQLAIVCCFRIGILRM